MTGDRVCRGSTHNALFHDHIQQHGRYQIDDKGDGWPKINIPIVGERFEKKLIVKGLEKVNKELEDHLPSDWAELLDDVSDGIEPGSPADLQSIKDNLVEFLNKKINIPIIGEKAEAKLLSAAIDIIFDALQKGKKLQD